MLEIRSKGIVPEEMKNIGWWRHKCLTDLFWLCGVVLHHGKKREFRDINEIHNKLCDFIDFVKTPILQKLILMFRDSLKSSFARAFVIQWFLRKRFQKLPGEIFMYAGIVDLVEKHLERIIKEILENKLLQALFYNYLPHKKKEFDSCSMEKGIRYEGIWIDLGSPEKTLTGGHYEGGINDNLVNEVNSRIFSQRQKTFRRWQEQEPILIENAWELIFETTWWPDDVSGLILNKDGLFDYSQIKRKPAHTFVSDMGYAVFSCPARGEDGKPIFEAKVDEKYLKRKRSKMGSYLYNALYELQPVAEEDVVFHPKWIINYLGLPDNFIRNMVVDCAGTTGKESSHSAISLTDWDEDGVMNLPYAHKRKVTPLKLIEWMEDVVKMSEKDKRPITLIGIEKEKYGIFLADILRSKHPDWVIIPIDIKNLPRPTRNSELIPLYENGMIRSKKGLTDYEDEVRTYYLDKVKGTDILDTIYYQTRIKLVPKKRDKSVFIPPDPTDFEKQIKRIRAEYGAPERQIAARF